MKERENREQNFFQKFFGKDLRHDIKELREFYLTDQRKQELRGKNPLSKTLHSIVWMLEELLERLSTHRKILLAFGFLFIILADPNSGALRIVGLLALLLIVMLELKDKIIAKDELIAGHKIQSELMPERTPYIPGYSAWIYSSPAFDVGGDLVDYQKISDSKYCLALGDIAGKGLSAALILAKLQATLRALAPDFYSLADFGNKVNQIFFRDGIKRSFASLFYMKIDTDKNSISAINAGHLPPVILKNDTIEELPKGNTALGIINNNSYNEFEINLSSGDYLIVFSDGITEAKNPYGQFLGKEDFFEILKEKKRDNVELFGEAVLEKISDFIGDTPSHDDLSIIILKRH